MAAYSQYIAYFKHQAVSHPSLVHQDLNGEKVFEIIDVEEALGDFRTGVKEKGRIMRLLSPTMLPTQNGGQYTNEIQGGFIVAQYYQKGNKPSFITAMDETETICSDIIEKMISDSADGHPLFYSEFDIPSVTSMQPRGITGDGSYAGWLVLFTMEPFWKACIDPTTVAWTDGGRTPDNP